MSVRVKVTNKDINKAKEAPGQFDPIVLAVSRALGTGNVMVGKTVVMVRGQMYKLPITAEMFIWAYDRGYRVFPFTFDMKECQ